MIFVVCCCLLLLPSPDPSRSRIKESDPSNSVLFIHLALIRHNEYNDNDMAVISSNVVINPVSIFFFAFFLDRSDISFAKQDQMIRVE